MINKEELETTPLNTIIIEISKISQYQDGIMMLVHEETNPDIKVKLLDEYDKAQKYYLLLNGEIMRRWGFDLDHPFDPNNEMYKRVKK